LPTYIKTACLNSFENIYTNNYTKLFRVAIKLIGNKDYAHDIVHDVFESLYYKLNNGNLVNCPEAWLYKAVSNKCVDYSRHNKNMVKFEPNSHEKTEEPVDDTNDKTLVLNKALTLLKMQERTLLALYSEGFSYKEISDITRIKFSSVGKMISRALEKLENELKKLNYELY
jgi:RNA polymerase sigma-70 factor, ECF subfamily